jgi:hypothetical protein
MHTTALSILLSILFQLASFDPEIQHILVESNQRELKNNTTATKDLLKQALSLAGPVFILVDGLDEIYEDERRLLLSHLLEVVDECNETRLCVSSRKEDDIARVMRNAAETIRVDRKNAGSIQSYIRYRFDEWMKITDFLPEAKAEIHGLLSPVAANAKGKPEKRTVLTFSLTSAPRNVSVCQNHNGQRPDVE